ncbi:unnamed protein product [Durusdinium trenchii]|uniref:Uncharacterized protein n=2 Tax=Durusdinium trenchii TaxID=1381693 RepID=A0ABP0SX27_9DINO
MASTFDRIFGFDETKGPVTPLGVRNVAVLPNGPWSMKTEEEPRKNRKSWPQAKRLETGLCEENAIGQVLGSRKKRIQEPGHESGVGAALSPRQQAWSGGSPRSIPADSPEPGDKDLFTPSGRPLRRRFPSVDRGSVPLPPWVSVGDCSPPSPRSPSPRRNRSPRAARSPSPRSPSPRTQDRRVIEWSTGYDLDAYRCIKVFPGNVHYKSSSALNPARAVMDLHKEEHAGLVGRDGLPKGGCKRHISPNSRGTEGLIAFTPPPSPQTDASSPSASSPSARENLHSFQSSRAPNGTLSLLSPIPRKRLQSPESPVSEEHASAAGMASPRFSWAADMVPDRKEVRSFSPRSPARDAVSPRSLIRSPASLGTGLYAEEPQSMLENFLGARKGRVSTSPEGPSAPSRASPPASSPSGETALGFGSLSWGKVAAGGYGLDVASRQAVGGLHGSGAFTQAVRTTRADVTFKEPLFRHREKVLEHRAQSPRRWR